MGNILRKKISNPEHLLVLEGSSSLVHLAFLPCRVGIAAETVDKDDAMGDDGQTLFLSSILANEVLTPHGTGALTVGYRPS